MLEPVVRHVVVLGLQVVDPVGFSLYCARVRPVLTRHGGQVEYDLVVGEVIECPVEAEINRVQALSFPGRAERRAYEADPEQRRLHDDLYVRSVTSTLLLGAYDAPG